MWNYDANAEKSVIGCMMTDPSTLAGICGALRPIDFVDKTNALIFQAATRLYNAGKAVDIITLSDAAFEVREGDPLWSAGYLGELARYVPTTVNYMDYVEIVQDKAARRRMAKIGEAAINAAQDEARPIQETRTSALNAVGGMRVGQDDGEDTSARATMAATLQFAMERAQSKGDMMTGLADLDIVMGGMHNGELTILAARPAMGKSSVAWQIADNFAQRGQRALFISCEMVRAQLGTRWAAMYGADATGIRLGKLDDAGWEKLGDVVSVLDSIPLHVSTRARTPKEIGAEAKRMIDNGGLGLLVIDHLQLLKADGYARSNYETVTQVSREIKLMATALNIPILLLSQLSREVEKRANRMPQLSDLRESGAIEQDADNILFLMAPQCEEHVPVIDRELYEAIEREGNHLTYCSLAKHRNGPLMEGKLLFRPKEMRVYSLAHDFTPIDDSQTEMEAAG